jgi:ADP-ribose pyrophosphatase YjhB (NUDIX family)
MFESEYEKPSVSIDIALVRYNQGLEVLLGKRNDPVENDKWALIGGYFFVDKDQNLMDTVIRTLKTKVNIENVPYVEQVETVFSKNRDPRGVSGTVLHFAIMSYDNSIKLAPGSNIAELKWFKMNELPHDLAFDHTELLNKAIQRIKNKVEYTNLPYLFLNNEFTINELKQVYDTIRDKIADKKKFYKWMSDYNFLEKTGTKRRGAHKPADLYTMKNKLTLVSFDKVL